MGGIGLVHSSVRHHIGITIRALIVHPEDINKYLSGRLRHCRILMLRRADNVFNANLWEIPGGKAEYMECLTSALDREVLEEVGIQLDWRRPRPYINEHIQPSDNGHWLSFTYWCGYSGKEPYIKEPHNFSDMRWVALGDVQDLELTTSVDNLIQDIRHEWANT